MQLTRWASTISRQVAPSKRYRTAPLKDSEPTRRGGFSHNGRFATLPDVVEHNTFSIVG
jgi:cytochrome c peroxidase